LTEWCRRIAGMPAAGPTSIVSTPSPFMASRALIAMLTIAVSNCPRSARVKIGSSGSFSTSSTRDPLSV
jgi:hypothetical protein